MISPGQAEFLFKISEDFSFPGIRKELERIGYSNVINLFNDDKKKRLIHYIYGNKPQDALKLLSIYPSEEN